MSFSSSDLARPSVIGRWLGSGSVIRAAVFSLVILPPLAFGAVHPWAFRVIEVVTFATAAIALAGLWLGGVRPVGDTNTRLIAPVCLLVGAIALQLIPLPPPVLGLISPAAYRIYSVAFDGWPQRTGLAWRPVSIAPRMTWGSLLKALAYISLFFLVVHRGSLRRGVQHRTSFVSALILLIVAMGVVVAVIGIAEWATWNGRILWFFVPRDWGDSPITLTRASGPFVNPDHFGDYLAMTLPLALCLAICGAPFTMKRGQNPGIRVIYAGATIVMVAALLLSLSRGAWIGAAAGMGLMAALWNLRQTPPPQVVHSRSSSRAALSTRSRKKSNPWRAAMTYTTAAIVLVMMALIMVGPYGREQVDSRLGQTIASQADFPDRVLMWKGTARMLHDFPILGVGLSCWPEIFPHYQDSPASQWLTREAHNDYLQLISEVGLLGFAAVVWLIWRLASIVRSAAGRVCADRWPALAALLSGLVAGAVQESLDFSWRIPGIAILATVMIGLVVRIDFVIASRKKLARRRFDNLGFGAGVLALTLLALAAGLQKTDSYPFYLNQLATIADAPGVIDRHPANGSAHLSLAVMESNTKPAAALRELQAAIWLAPNEVSARDLYAWELMGAGRTAEGLEAIRQSVLAAPSLDRHFYLASGLAGGLSPREGGAVEAGLSEAVRRGYDGAVDALGRFYVALGKHGHAAALYANAGERENVSERRAALLASAGESYVRAGNYTRAKELLERAIAVEPDASIPYQDLVTMIYGPRKDLKSAQTIVERGIQNGADPELLYTTLADIAEGSAEVSIAEKALLALLDTQPDFPNRMALGLFYLREKQFDKAIETMRAAAEIKPDSVQAYSALAAADEGAYRYADAQRDYRRAIALAPDDSALKYNYQQFMQKLASRKPAMTTSAPEKGEFE